MTTNTPILANLRELNFNELIHIDTNDAANYNYEIYRANGGHKIKNDGIGGCNKCETIGLASSLEIGLKPKLSLISHGTHTRDYFSFLKSHSTSNLDWRDDPVMFVLESPSVDSGQYNGSDVEFTWKNPAKSWYWLPDEKETPLNTYDPLNYITNSTQGKYGEYFASIIYRFGLRNAYITNMQKCGASKAGKAILDSGQCKDIRDTCIRQYLSQEINIFKPEVIFAFGINAYDGVRKKFKDYIPSQKLICLPHPASRHSKINYQKTSHERLLFGLKVNGIINDQEEHKLTDDFIKGQ